MNRLIHGAVCGFNAVFGLEARANFVFPPTLSEKPPISPATQVALETFPILAIDPTALALRPIEGVWLTAADLDRPDPELGATALHRVVFDNRLDPVEWLLNLGANPECATKHGHRPLHFATHLGHTLATKLLLQHGAELNVAVDDRTPLMSAIAADHEECANLLLEARADITGSTTKGLTPLHIAAENGRVWAIKTLLDKGMNVHSRDFQNYTPLVAAAHFGQPACARLLLEAGAEGPGFEDQQIWNGHSKCLLAYPALATAAGLGQNPISRELLAARVMAQSLEFKGKVSFLGGVLELEKGGGSYYSGVMLDSLRAFVREYPGQINSNEISELVSFLLSGYTSPGGTRDPEVIFEEIRHHAVVQLPTGFSEHAVISVIVDDYFIINNKGALSNRPGEIYKIDKTKLTVDDVRQMISDGRSPSEYFAWRISLPKVLGAAPDEFSQFIEGLYPLHPRQLLNNCSWASVEIGVFFILAVKRFLPKFKASKVLPSAAEIHQLQNTFIHWVRFTQLGAIEAYLGHIDRREISFNAELAALTYNQMLKIDNWYGMDTRVETCKQRLRPNLSI